MKKLIISLVAAASVASINVAIAGDAAAGKARAQACASCHGADGISTQPVFPNLKGQKEEYLKIALKAYKDGSRKNSLMNGMAGTLSDADIDNLAAYFSSL